MKAARRVRLQILDASQKIAESPGIGHRREHPTDKPVLFWPVSSYLIITTRPESLLKSFESCMVRATFQACCTCSTLSIPPHA